MQLNLGCGRYPKAGFVNVDWQALPGVDVVHDLTRTPYPFKDAEFERIEADHVIQSLPNVFPVMREIHRILRQGGMLVVRVPHFSRGFSHPEHRRGFDATFPYYFDPAFPGGYAGVAFKCETVRLRWFAQPYLKKSVLPRPFFELARTTGAVIDRVANIAPLYFSRLLSYYVGGFEEIEFEMRRL
jgi:SAM-dependent methyltransferase